jgi:hypothetical protein
MSSNKRRNSSFSNFIESAAGNQIRDSKTFEDLKNAIVSEFGNLRSLISMFALTHTEKFEEFNRQLDSLENTYNSKFEQMQKSNSFILHDPENDTNLLNGALALELNIERFTQEVVFPMMTLETIASISREYQRDSDITSHKEKYLGLLQGSMESYNKHSTHLTQMQKERFRKSFFDIKYDMHVNSIRADNENPFVNITDENELKEYILRTMNEIQKMTDFINNLKFTGQDGFYEYRQELLSVNRVVSKSLYGHPSTTKHSSFLKSSEFWNEFFNLQDDVNNYSLSYLPKVRNKVRKMDKTSDNHLYH